MVWSGGLRAFSSQICYRMSRFPIPPAGNSDNQKHTPEGAVVSAWSAQPQCPPNPLQSLSLFAPNGQKRNQEEKCPITVNFARAVRESAWATYWHVSYRQLHLPAPPSVVSPKNSEERTDTGTVPAGNKTGDQIKICVPSLLKEKWRSEIQ